MAIEIARVQPERIAEFMRSNEREALKTFYDFSVIWFEQRHQFAAIDGENVVGAAEIRIAASLAHVESVVVAPSHRREGIGRRLLEASSDVANYYNCHKMTVLVPHKSPVERFFEACDYKEEAVLPQHTFKLDMAVMRKFLL
ncbi:MAG: GNAT family N-acetyltransferase [Candidatus Eremiobacteraeota bacterium]|nr:GNAT family N-acetyltransferase [Candidatus Eremiobacteraeota bacterium]